MVKTHFLPYTMGHDLLGEDPFLARLYLQIVFALKFKTKSL